PDPDALLRAISEQEQKAKSANLRIFLGMSAGVGKTFSMLRAAQARAREGLDIVIGVVETHGRIETMALAESLPVIPRKKIEYKGVVIQEMDLEAILAKKPKIVLVDELAHTNAPGSRHQKRYQDVLEILSAGIDVYTTVNVQHFESRKDLVEQITGVPIRETVPDSILERASQVELIDITPNELLLRLKEGKIYLGEKAELAAQNFFKPDSLTALREIALRVTAERVDQELQQLQELKQTSGPWQTNERLMVAVSHSPYSERVIRATRRLAYNLESPWIAIHIDTGIQLNDEDQSQLTKNIALARELNAEVITTTDTDVPAAIRRIAKQKNVTQVVLGRPTKRIFRDFFEGGTLLDRLVRESVEIDVHVIRQDGVPNFRPPWITKIEHFSSPINYWNGFLFLVGVSILNGFIEPLIGYRSVGFIFLLGVLGVGLLSTIGPTLFVAALSALVWNYFFIAPRFTFAIHESADIILILIYLLAAMVTGFLTSRIRSHERILREREDRTNVLFEVSQDIAGSQNKDEFLSKINARIGRLLDGECGIILASQDKTLLGSETKNYSPKPVLTEKENAVAAWAFESTKIAGWSTETLSESNALYIPLKAPNQTVGVLVYRPRTKRKLNLDQENILYSISSQLAVSLERHFFEKRLRESEKLKVSEKIHQTLLNSISHEMRTPLTTVMGTASALVDEDNSKNPKYVRDLAGQLLDAGDRLNHVIENLLDMSRLNSGVLALNLEWHDVNDLVGVTLKKLEKNLKQHRVVVDIPNDLPLIKVDFKLMEHALANLLLNAANYSLKGKEIRVAAHKENNVLKLIIEDHGPGIPEDLLESVFEKFFRVPGTPTGGVGLGLSIVKNIAEIHNGSVRAENCTHGGARLSMELPLSEAPSHPEDNL
ncbi:MAG: sensor histidine kinase KdpD, partial [Bdellovibrionales bacterium]